MIPPHTRHLVQHRFQRMGIQRHQTQRKVRGDKGISQRGKGKCRQQELQICSRFGDGHPAGPAFLGANQGNDRLHTGDQKGKDKGEVAKLCNHAVVIVLCAYPSNRIRTLTLITLSRPVSLPACQHPLCLPVA